MLFSLAVYYIADRIRAVFSTCAGYFYVHLLLSFTDVEGSRYFVSLLLVYHRFYVRIATPGLAVQRSRGLMNELFACTVPERASSRVIHDSSLVPYLAVLQISCGKELCLVHAKQLCVHCAHREYIGKGERHYWVQIHTQTPEIHSLTPPFAFYRRPELLSIKLVLSIKL